jgi:nucleotide-binding universal stress UspA family protein
MSEHTVVAVDGGPASEAAIAWVIDRLATGEMQLEITTVIAPRDPLPDDADGRHLDPYQQLLDAAKHRVLAARPSAVVTTRVRHGVPADELISASRHASLLVIGTNRTSRAVGVMRGTLPLNLAGRAYCTTVVVPVDWQPSSGSVIVGWTDDATADAALDLAATEAARRGAGLTIVHTWGAVPAAPLESVAPPAVEAAVAAEHRQLLVGAAQRIRLAHRDLSVTHLLHGGSAAVAIVRAAAGASLVVVGSRGRGGLTAFLLGSVSQDVLLNLPAPVAVVPRTRSPHEVYPEFLVEDF